MKQLINYINTIILKMELKRNHFIIGGYDDKLIRIIGYRFLQEWEIELVHKWRSENKLIECGIWEITSPATGLIYAKKLYKLT